MAKAPTPTAPPAPELNLAPAIEISAPEPVAETAEPTPELVAVDTTPEPVTTVLAPAGPRTVRLAPTHGFPIRHFNGGVTFYPGYPAEVPLDAWLENQIACGILAEV